MAAASAKAAGGSSWQAALRRHKPHDAPALVELERNSLADLKLAQHAVRHEPRNHIRAAVGGTHVAEPCVKVQLGHCAGLRAGSWEKGCVYGRLIVEVGGLEGEFEARGLLVPVLRLGRGREPHVRCTFGELGADGPPNRAAARLYAGFYRFKHVVEGACSAVAEVLLPSTVSADVECDWSRRLVRATCRSTRAKNSASVSRWQA